MTTHLSRRLRRPPVQSAGIQFAQPSPPADGQHVIAMLHGFSFHHSRKPVRVLCSGKTAAGLRCRSFALADGRCATHSRSQR